MQKPTEVLREKGMKVTPQRLAIYNFIKQSKEHPTAETIYSHLYPIYPTISLSTVYKTLLIFKERGLLLELQEGGESRRYDANVEPHDHFCCIGCNELHDVMDDGINEIQLPKALDGYDVKFERSYYFGLCPKCVKLKKAN